MKLSELITPEELSRALNRKLTPEERAAYPEENVTAVLDFGTELAKFMQRDEFIYSMAMLEAIQIVLSKKPSLVKPD